MQPGLITSMFIQDCSNQQGSLIDVELKPQYKTDIKPFCEDSWERFRAYSLVLMHMGEFWISQQLHNKTWGWCHWPPLGFESGGIQMSSEIAVSVRGSHTIVTTPTQTLFLFLASKNIQLTIASGQWPTLPIPRGWRLCQFCCNHVDQKGGHKLCYEMCPPQLLH